MATASPIPENTVATDNTAADLLVLVTAMAPEHFKGVLANLEDAFAPGSFVVATQNELPANIPSSLHVVATPQSTAAWSLKPIDFVNAAQFGREHGAKAFLILGPESDSLSPLALRSLADAVLKASIDLVVPHYSLPSNAGLINSAILYPLTRAVFASRVRFPLSIDLGMSSRMAERLASVAEPISSANQADALMWPVNEAVASGFIADEVDVGSRAMPQPSDPDINSILALVTGSLFADIEAKAALWQRPRKPPLDPPADGRCRHERHERRCCAHGCGVSTGQRESAGNMVACTAAQFSALAPALLDPRSRRVPHARRSVGADCL